MEAAGDGVVVVVVGRPSPVVGTVGTVGDGTVSTVTVGRWAGGTRTFESVPGPVAANATPARSTITAVPMATNPACRRRRARVRWGRSPASTASASPAGGAVDPSRRASSVSAGSNPKSSSVMVRPPFPSRFP